MTQVTVIDTAGHPHPLYGPQIRSDRTLSRHGIFESGFYDFDDHYAFTALPTVQGLMSSGDVVNDIELRADDPNRAPRKSAKAGRT